MNSNGLGRNLDIEYLLSIFRKSSNYFYQDTNTRYKSRHWKNNFDNKDWNKENLKSFRGRGGLSTGIDGIFDFPVSAFVCFAEELGENVLFELLDKKNTGQSPSIKYRDVYLDYNKLFAAYWYKILLEQIKVESQFQKYFEIGGGLGQLAEIILRNHKNKVFLIDLPEANLLSALYLKELHEDKRFFLFDSYERYGHIDDKLIDEYDVFILPPGLNFSENINFDIFVNTRSMMEMEKQVIEDYFDFIQRHSIPGTLFLNVNRYEKNSVGEPIRIAEYPYDPHWEVIRSHPNILQDHIHLILSQRITNNRIGSIIAELENIRLHSEPYIYKKSIKSLFHQKFGWISSFLKW